MSEELKVTPEQETKDTPEYIESMVKKSEGNTPVSEEVLPTEPKEEELILGKFKTQEDLLKSYQELEKKLSTPVEKNEEKPNTLKAEDQAKAPIFNFEDAQNEFQENGSLSEATVTNLEKAGLPKSYIDSYLAGLEAMASKFEQNAYEVTGGEENYKKMTEWVSNNLSAEEVKVFNDGVSADNNTALYHIKNMAARFNSETKEPLLKYGETNTSTSGARYESISQMKADMNDPRYAKDQAFRKEVEQKLSRSNIL